MDDLEDCWADIKPPAKPKPPPTEIEPGYLWMGLLDADRREPEGMGYERQRVAIPAGESMTFEATYPDTLDMIVTTVTLHSCQRGGEVLWSKALDTLHVRPGNTLNMQFVLHDLTGEMGERLGFRAMLKLRGIL